MLAKALVVALCATVAAYTGIVAGQLNPVSKPTTAADSGASTNEMGVQQRKEQLVMKSQVAKQAKVGVQQSCFDCNCQTFENHWYSADVSSELACHSACVMTEGGNWDIPDFKVGFNSSGYRCECAQRCHNCNPNNRRLLCQDSLYVVDATSGCFPAKSRVTLAGNKSKAMSELQLGDMVHIGNGEHSEVFLFSHQMSEINAQFVQISTAASQITLTPGHFLYVNGELQHARSVKVGDSVTLGDGSTIAVLSTSLTWALGLYNPHTKAGDIIVDGIKTSCYTEAVHPTLAHALLMPVRALYEAGVTFGESFKAGPDSSLWSALPKWLVQALRI